MGGELKRPKGAGPGTWMYLGVDFYGERFVVSTVPQSPHDIRFWFTDELRDYGWNLKKYHAKRTVRDINRAQHRIANGGA